MSWQPWAFSEPFIAYTPILAEEMNPKLNGISASFTYVADELNVFRPRMPSNFSGNIEIPSGSYVNTLLGVDLVKNGELVAQDCTAEQLLTLTQDQPTKIIITIIGGQGHIIGRGNQQLSADLLTRVGKENILLLATKTKLNELEGRPLVCDSISQSLNQVMSGVIPVITGYHDKVLYRIAEP